MADNGKDTPDKDAEIKLSVDDIANIPQPELSSVVADLLDGPIPFHHPEQYDIPEIKAYAEQMKEFDSQFLLPTKAASLLCTVRPKTFTATLLSNTTPTATSSSITATGQ